VYRILYEEVDESDVKLLSIVPPVSEGGSVDEYRYPTAGKRVSLSLGTSYYFKHPS